MTMALTVAFFIAAIVAASVLSFVFSLLASRTSLREIEDRINHQLRALADAVKSLEIELSQLRKSPPVLAAPASVAQTPAEPAEIQEKETEEISPETLVVLAGAVTAFLGKKVRIRSAKMLQSPYEIVNPWAQQGRMIVQASHNLPPRT